MIGTRSVEASERLATLLRERDTPHRVLNARQDAEEAEIVAEAGSAGRITVATNMAGRGTDIVLGEGVIERGGLHVICCQHNAARRIDQCEPGFESLRRHRTVRHFRLWRDVA